MATASDLPQLSLNNDAQVLSDFSSKYEEYITTSMYELLKHVN